MVVVELRLRGLLCMVNCGARVQAALARVPGVESVKIDVDLKQATLEASPIVKDCTLIQAVEAAGYEASSSQRLHITVDGMTCNCCVKIVENALKGVEGVKRSSVSVGSVDLEMGPFILPQVVVEAIENLGYDAKISQLLSPIEAFGRKKSMEIRITIEGLKTKAEANRLISSLRATSGVVCANLDQNAGLARVRIFSSLSPYILLDVLKEEGFGRASFVYVPEACEVSGAGSLATPTFVEEVEKNKFALGDSRVTMGIKGMTCGACVATIENALMRVPGVVRAKVGLLTEVAEIFYDGGVTDAERLKDFVETVGYEANITPR